MQQNILFYRLFSQKRATNILQIDFYYSLIIFFIKWLLKFWSSIQAAFSLWAKIWPIGGRNKGLWPRLFFVFFSFRYFPRPPSPHFVVFENLAFLFKNLSKNLKIYPKKKTENPLTFLVDTSPAWEKPKKGFLGGTEENSPNSPSSRKKGV